MDRQLNSQDDNQVKKEIKNEQFINVSVQLLRPLIRSRSQSSGSPIKGLVKRKNTSPPEKTNFFSLTL